MPRSATPATSLWRGKSAERAQRTFYCIKQVDRPLRRAMRLVSGFAAITNIERRALDPPLTFPRRKVCLIVTLTSYARNNRLLVSSAFARNESQESRNLHPSKKEKPNV